MNNEYALQPCFDYLGIMLAEHLAIAEEQGYPYLLFCWNILNNNGVFEPVYERAYIKDLNDVFRMVKMGAIDFNCTFLIDTETGEHVDTSIFRKGE